MSHTRKFSVFCAIVFSAIGSKPPMTELPGRAINSCQA